MIKNRQAFLFFLLWSIWLSLEFLLGPYSHVRIADTGDGTLPQLIAAKIQYSKYGFEYFADYMASGVDSSAIHLLPFSSLNSLLFTVLPGWGAYGLLMLIQRFLASYFTYRLCRDSFNFNVWPSIIAGLIYSLFNLSMFSYTIYHQLGLPAIPFILWIINKINSNKTNQKFIYFTLFGLFIGYTNYIVIFTPYVLPLIFIWYFVIQKNLNTRLLLGLVIFSLSIAFVQMQSAIAIILNGQFSHRLSWIYPNYSDHLTGVMGLITYIFRSNVVSIVIIFFSMLSIKIIKNVVIKRFLTITLILITINIAYKLIQPYILHNLGQFRSFSVDRLAIYISFFFTMTATSFLNNLVADNNKKIMAKTVIAIIIIFLIGTTIKIKFDSIQNYAPYKNLYEHPDLIALAKLVDSTKWRVVTITGGGVRSSYALAYGLSSVDAYTTLYPQNYHKFWAKIISKRISNDKLRYEDFIYWGNRIYLYGPQDFYSLQNIEFQKYYDLDLLSYAGVKYVISQKTVTDENLTLLPSSYREGLQDWDKFTKFQKLTKFIKGEYFGPPLYIYENKKAFPRFFTIENGQISEQSVNVDSYSPDKITLSLRSSQPAILVATINNYPWWKASVNNKEVPLANYEGTFMSLGIPTGESQVELKYLPPYKL